MKSHNFKSCAKYGLFLILVISLAGTANASTDHTGGIALSWDDVGSIDPCYQYISIFQKYNATSTINVNTLSGSTQSTIDHLNALHADGWEIAAHGQNHADSIAFLNNYSSTEWLNKEIFPNIAEINGYGYTAHSFAYPYSERNEATDALLVPYFRTIRSTAFETMEGMDVNKSGAYYKWDDTQVLYAVEIDDKSNATLESIQYGIDYAINNGYVLLLYGHAITSSDSPAEYQTSISRLDSILNYTYQKGGKFYHLEDLGNSSWAQPPIFSNVTANFTVSKDSVIVGESVSFTDYSINQASELLDFGDGSNSSTATVTHTYTTPGTYTATLTVTNDVSSQSMTKTITVVTGYNGGIALSWDDVGSIDPCRENLPAFQKYNAICTVNLNSLSGSPQSTKDNLSALHAAGWEIAAHGFNHEDPVAFLNNHTSQEWLDQEIIPNIAEITGYGYPVYSFAYPYGSQNGTTDALLAPYFRTLRTTNFGTVNVNESAAYYKWDDTQVLYGVEIDDQSNVSLGSIQYGIDYATKYGYVLVLYGHSITSNVTGPYQTSTSRLDSILNYTYQKGGKFYHMGNLGNSSWSQPSISFNVTANFTSNPTTGFAPLNVAFTDTSTGLPTSWLWDFGDGATSTVPSPTHTYSAAGPYTVNLTVSNGNNFASKTATITVLASNSDDDGGSSGGSRGSSGGSSGGGGGSPEPARNVEVKELSQVFITNGKATKFDFTKNATCVVYVGFDSKKTVGKTTTTVEQLKSKSTLVSSLSEGEVYRYFNVWVGNSGFATSKNIDNPTICFKVEKSWVQDKKIDQDSIALNRYSDKKWEQLPVSLLKEDSKYLYFTADVPGYSFFAITGKTNTTPGETVTEIDDSDNTKDMENTNSEVNQESGEKENTGMPGFEMVYGVAGLLAVFLYKRR